MERRGKHTTNKLALWGKGNVHTKFLCSFAVLQMSRSNYLFWWSLERYYNKPVEIKIKYKDGIMFQSITAYWYLIRL